MKYVIPFFLILGACAGHSKKGDIFADKKGCFLLYNVTTGKYEKEEGTTCRERFVACSTFKVPLAIMAFDSGILRDENEVLKWDKVERPKIPEWNMDHNAKSWMSNSVVWFSQKLTPMLGEKKFKKYLSDFQYGNQDISHGITDAWLVSPSLPESSLRISPYEQVEFLKALWKETLPVSKRAMELTRKITYRETTPRVSSSPGRRGPTVTIRKTSFSWDGLSRIFREGTKSTSLLFSSVISFPKKRGPLEVPAQKICLKNFWCVKNYGEGFVNIPKIVMLD